MTGLLLHITQLSCYTQISGLYTGILYNNSHLQLTLNLQHHKQATSISIRRIIPCIKNILILLLPPLSNLNCRAVISEKHILKTRAQTVLFRLADYMLPHQDCWFLSR